MRKDLENSYSHIEFLVRLLHKSDIEYVVTAILIELGIPAKLEGSQFVKTAILIYDKHSIGLVKARIYKGVAEAFGGAVSVETIEKAIRSAIKAGWEAREGKMWEYYFPDIDLRKKKPPSNHEFIAEMARVLELWVGIRQTYEYELEKKEVSHGIE